MADPLLDLVRRLGLGDPQSWLTPGESSAGQPLRDYDPTFEGPQQVRPMPTTSNLTGIGRAFDYGLDAVVQVLKGATGLGDQGPAGPTWTNAAALAAAIPAGTLGAVEKLAGRLPRFAAALKAYQGPTQAVEAAEGAMRATVRPAAPFYSRLEEAAETLPGKFGPGALAKGQVSAEELAARKVPEFLAAQGSKPIPKAALQEHLAANPVPALEVKTLGDAPADLVRRQDMAKAQADTYRSAAFDDPREWVGVSRVDQMNARHWAYKAAGGDQAALAKLQRVVVDPEHLNTILTYGRYANESRELNELRLAQHPRPKFAQYQLPGGENYRENLITLKPTGKDVHGYPRDEAAPGWGDIGTRPTDRSDLYTSPHWTGEPNVLVHTRTNERELPELGKGLFLEEVQSDWHQKGKSGGYKLPAAEEAELRAQYNTLARQSEAAETRFRELGATPGRADTPERAAYLAAAAEVDRLRDAKDAILEKTRGAVPDAPFKESWPDLALKHHLAEAAANPDLNWIGFTSGETQAARYDLSKQVSEIAVKPVRMAGDREGVTSGWRLTAKGHEGQGNVITEDLADLSKLSDFIGKDAAKAAAAQVEAHGAATLTGLDLKVGGEGMHEFYDKLLPKRLEKIVKQYGGTVERARIPGGIAEADHGTRALGEAFFDAAHPESLVNGKLPVGPHRTLLSRDQLAEAFSSGRFNAFDMPNYLQEAVQKAGGVKHPAWILKLTPELRARILKWGVPLMAGVAAVEVGDELRPEQLPAAVQQ
jgi:hypothetical protein